MKFVLFLFFVFTLSAEQKVIYLSIPKAGTHLLRKAIELLIHEETRWIGLRDIPYFDPENFLREPTRVVGTHLFPELDVIRTRYGSDYRKIILIRDPRDVMVSFMHHLANNLTWVSAPQFDYEKFKTLSPDEMLRETLLFPVAYRNPAVSFDYAALWMQDPSVFVCRFEDLVGEEGGGSREKQREVLRNLATFLQLDRSEEEVERVAMSLYGGTWTFRKGQIGSWKEAYSPENQMLFEHLMGASVFRLGYQ